MKKSPDVTNDHPTVAELRLELDRARGKSRFMYGQARIARGRHRHNAAVQHEKDGKKYNDVANAYASRLESLISNLEAARVKREAHVVEPPPPILPIVATRFVVYHRRVKHRN